MMNSPQSQDFHFFRRWQQEKWDKNVEKSTRISIFHRVKAYFHFKGFVKLRSKRGIIGINGILSIIYHHLLLGSVFTVGYFFMLDQNLLKYKKRVQESGVGGL